jgi:hypothetical protein
MQQHPRLVHIACPKVALAVDIKLTASVTAMSNLVAERAALPSLDQTEHVLLLLNLFGQIKAFVIRRAVLHHILAAINIYMSLTRHSFIHTISRYRNRLERDLKLGFQHGAALYKTSSLFYHLSE